MTRLRLIMTVLRGIATWYAPEEYSECLRCLQSYDEHTPVWVAVDDSMLAAGWRCKDLLKLTYADGEVLYPLLLDTGFLHRHYVEDFGPEQRIVVDVPWKFWHRDDMSIPVRVENLSAAERAFHERRAR